MAQTTTNGSVQLASSTPMVQNMKELMQRCIQHCIETANICEQTIQHCLQKGGKHADPDHLRLLRDCAESCTMSAGMMSRQSTFQAKHCRLCAEICRACAESCEQFGDDPQMKACAEACRLSESTCAQM